MYKYPVIPESIVVHLGSPSSNARNIRVNFIEYIKNVASGELYPNWPNEALRANILAIISFTLNRVYNEWYRSQGYSFDITSTSQYDQSFSEDRQFFERIYVLVDELFDSYLVRNGQIQPLFASYCDGKNTTCSGLSQWGSVTLANQGYNALQILKKYYGNDIMIVSDVRSSVLSDSFVGGVLALGDAGDMVRFLKIWLNRIGQNYPAIPLISKDTIYYDVELENAVKVFQSTFSLPVTGKVDLATWYKIKYYYNAVKKIASLSTEGIKQDEIVLQYPEMLKLGDKGSYMKDIHYYFQVISCFDNQFMDVEGDTFTDRTEENVITFQRKYSLPVTGEIDYYTWNKLKEVYKSYIESVPLKCRYSLNEFFSGRYLSLGMSGEDVLNLQNFLYVICQSTHEIPGVVVSREFDSLTEQSVRFLQKKFGLVENGVVSADTWRVIVDYEKSL